MKRSLLMALCLCLFTHKLMSQPDTLLSFPVFQQQITSLSDSTRFERLYDYSVNALNQSKYSEAALATNEMLQIAQQLNNQLLIGRTYMAMGNMERNQNSPTNAISHYLKAQSIFGSIGEYRRQLRALQRIEGVYISLRELEKAQQYCEQALTIARQQKLELEIANIYNDLASIEDIRKKYNQALHYNELALRIYQSLKEEGSYTVSLFNRAIILKNSGQYRQSADIYQQCLKAAKEKQDVELEGMVYINLPNTLLLLNQLNEAEKYIRMALTWANSQSKSPPFYQNIYETLTAIYEKRGQFQQAFQYQKLSMVYRDSVMNAEKSRQLIETETRFQTREKQLHIERLDEDNHRQKQQLAWLTGGAILLTFLLGIMLLQYRTIRRVNGKLTVTNQTLSLANERINKQSGQLKELMRELHHRVKNNLAIVSSLLYLQSNRLEDENAVRAVREGQQRVEAMSLIHQQLYQTDNVTRVNMQTYIDELVRGLMQSFNHQDNFDLRLTIAPIDLDVELAVPLGLILNELTTNAFKHAYKGIDVPSLSISLWKEDQLYLEITDNGPGIDVSQWQKPSRSFGKRLITSLTKQAGGRLEISGENGTRFLLILPVPEKKAILTPEPEPAMA